MPINEFEYELKLLLYSVQEVKPNCHKPYSTDIDGWHHDDILHLGYAVDCPDQQYDEKIDDGTDEKSLVEAIMHA